MPRPSRQEEAKAAISRYYADHGVMPTIEVLAQVMGYHSTSSAHNTVMGLVKSGYLAQEERGGRLLPGTGFTRSTGADQPAIPLEIIDGLPAGVALCVLTVPVGSLVDQAVLEGDMLVLAPLSRTDLSPKLLLSRGISLTISNRRKAGWRALGVLVAQFRSYR